MYSFCTHLFISENVNELFAKYVFDNDPIVILECISNAPNWKI